MQQLLNNRTFLWLIFGLFLFNLLVLNHSVMLWDEDEAAYAGFAMQMLNSGDWLIPEFVWSEIHRKPPLHFWTLALSYKLFGVSEFATRLPSVLYTLATLAVFFFIGKKIFGEAVIKTACLFLMASLFLPNIAKVAVVDASLLFYQTLSVLALFAFMQTPSWRWNLLFWGGISMGVLLKGPPILILTGGVWVFLAVFHPQRKRLIGTHPWLFLPLAISPLLVWGYAAYQQNPDFITWMLDWYIFKRVGGSVLGQTAPLGFYFAVFLASFLTLIPLIPAALWDFVKRIRARASTTLFLLAWLIFGWLFYELLPSKLPTYALGALPAFAILIAQFALQLKDKTARYPKLMATGSVFFVLLFFALQVGMIYTCFLMFGREVAVRAIFLTFLLWVPAFVFGTLIFAKRYTYGIGGLVLTGVLFSTFSWLVLMPNIEAFRNAPQRIGDILTKNINANTRVYIGNDFSKNPSIPFYIAKDFEYVSVDESSMIGAEYSTALVESLRSENPYTAVVGDQWVSIISDELRTLGDSLSHKIHVEGWATDHLEDSSYWILANDAAWKSSD